MTAHNQTIKPLWSLIGSAQEEGIAFGSTDEILYRLRILISMLKITFTIFFILQKLGCTL
jgi:hypothetical protein